MNADVRSDREEMAMTRVLLRPNEVAEAIGVGRTKLYALVNRGSIRSVRVDGSIRIPVGAVAEFVEQLESQARTSAT